jgi:hypothetical protein
MGTYWFVSLIVRHAYMHIYSDTHTYLSTSF